MNWAGIAEVRVNMPAEGRKLIKSIVQYIAAGATLLAVVAAAVAYFDLPPAERAAMWHGIGRVALWFGLVLVLPWATYFVSTAIARRESNAASVVLIAGYTAIDIIVLLLLVGIPASTFLILATLFGLLVALTYNLLTCDWIAERGV